jgi:hypothetical protein
MRRLLEREGPGCVLEALERLMRRGFEVAAESGASMSPFVGAALERPPAPAGDAPAAWQRYAEELAERIAARADYDEEDLGPQLLAVKSGARGALRHLLCLLGGRGATAEAKGKTVIVRRGLAEGLTAEEMFACAAGARRALGQVALDIAQHGYGRKQATEPKGFSVLARAMRASRPGVVFAHAAAIEEVDPLTDVDSRLFVGLPAEKAQS